MDRLKDRYFIRYNTKQQQGVRLPLCSARTLMRVFIHFISDDDFHSLEIYQEDYFNKPVSKMERKNGTLTAGKRQTLRQKVLGPSSIGFEHLTSQFQEGLYDPEEGDTYNGQEAVIQKFDEEQFGNAMEMFAIIQDEGSFKAN